jgi:AraC family transcriptional regulator of adaptative response / DNA-3-methyladenine glycosylase II
LTGFELRPDPPLERGPALAYLAAHTIAGAEVHEPEAGRHTRLVRTRGGPRTVTVTLGAGRLKVETDAAGGETDEVAATVRHWFGLDVDLALVREALGEDPLIGPLIAARPGLRVIGYPDPFEGAVMTVFGQQVSLARARNLGGNLVAAYGEPGPGGLMRFPEPARLAEVPAEELRETMRITGSRARTVRLLAEAFETGLRLDPSADRNEARERLAAIRGVGPWTVEYLAVRAMGDPDAFPAGDLGVRKQLGGIPTREAEALSERWRPWRAYALFHLWTVGAFLPAGSGPDTG